MNDENRFLLRDVNKVLRANTSSRVVINVRIAQVEKELIEGLQSLGEGNLVFTGNKLITLADIVDGSKSHIVDKENVLIVNATNEAGFSQIEYCLVNGSQLVKQSAVDIVFSTSVQLFNSDGYFSDEVL
jgi:hypothetical protein